MIDRISEVTTGLVELARAEGELAMARARASLVQLAVIVMGLTLASISIAAVLVAATWAIGSELGWISALAITGSAGVVLALSVLAISSRLPRWIQRSEDKQAALQRANKATLQIEGRSQLDPDQEKEKESVQPTRDTSANTSGEEDSESLQGRLIRAALENPAAVAGGAMTVVALLGPSKTLRLIGRTTMIAGLASSALDKLKESDGGRETTAR